MNVHENCMSSKSWGMTMSSLDSAQDRIGPSRASRSLELEAPVAAGTPSSPSPSASEARTPSSTNRKSGASLSSASRKIWATTAGSRTSTVDA